MKQMLSPCQNFEAEVENCEVTGFQLLCEVIFSGVVSGVVTVRVCINLPL
jgi:hypothetical protein